MGWAGQKNTADLRGQLELPNESQGYSRGLDACSTPCCQFHPGPCTLGALGWPCLRPSLTGLTC